VTPRCAAPKDNVAHYPVRSGGGAHGEPSAFVRGSRRALRRRLDAPPALRVVRRGPPSATKRRAGRAPLDHRPSSFVRGLRSADGAVGSRAPRTVLRHRWTRLRREIEGSGRLERPSLRQTALARLPGPILGILDGCEAADAVHLRNEVVSFLCAEDREALVPCLVQLLRATAEEPARTLRASSSLGTLRRHSVHLLRKRLELPERSADDWSIPLPAGCRCELCGTLEAFLSDPARERLEWRLAKQGRQHVHRRLDAYELPVRHETRRSGRPYTLVLSKTRALFEREARERRSLRADLEWLAAAGTGSSTRRPPGTTTKTQT